MKHTRKVAIAAAVIGGTLLFSAESCDKASEPFKDAKRGESNTGPADTITFPDGFSNVATKCDHGNRVYVLFKGDATYGGLAVVPHDESCKGCEDC